MAKISLIARITAVEGRESELEAAFEAVVKAASEEPGLEVYSVHAAQDLPGVYYFFEVYSDISARSTHGTGTAMTEALPALLAELSGEPEVTLLTPLFAKGISL